MHRFTTILFCSVALLVGVTGCLEENEPEPQQQEAFVPVEPGERNERHCEISWLNTDICELTPVEQLQEQFGKDGLDKLSIAAQTLDESEKNPLPEAVKRFALLNQKVPKKVVAAMQQANIRNYSIFLVKAEDNYYAIKTFEYIGQSYDLDMLELSRNKAYSRWNNACEECQAPIIGKQKDGGRMQWSLEATELLYMPLTQKSVNELPDEQILTEESKTPETSETPVTKKTPETSDVPKPTDASDTTDSSDVIGVSEPLGVPETSDNSETEKSLEY